MTSLIPRQGTRPTRLFRTSKNIHTLQLAFLIDGPLRVGKRQHRFYSPLLPQALISTHTHGAHTQPHLVCELKSCGRFASAVRRCILVVGTAGGEDGGMRLPRVVTEGESLHGCMSCCAGFACARGLVPKIHLLRGEFRLFRFRERVFKRCENREQSTSNI